MRRLAIGLIASAALLSGSCSGSGACKVDARTYAAGEVFPSADGCNSCQCEVSGDVACTARACVSGDDGGAKADGGDQVMCVGGMSGFPTFDKHCASPAECVYDFHQINCCGSQRAIGMNQAEKDRFARDEAICRTQYPRCGCPTSLPVAEDGKVLTDGKMIVLQCRMGACMTTVQ